MKRIVAWTLVLVMCFNMLGVTAAAAEATFTDVAADAYYAAPVAWAVDKGITNGMTETTFGPDSPCTRGHVVTFLWRAMGKPAPTQTTHSFTDIAEGEYYYDAVLWAVEKDVTTGMSATTFEPASPCTRGQVVTFLWRAMGKPAPTQTTHNFTDVEEGQYYYEPMLWAVEKGVTTGMSATTFEPQTTCNRGQVVTFLYRCLKDSKEPVTPTEPTTEPATEPAVEPLKIVVQPSDVVCGAGDTVSFSVTVQGGVEPYSYQWQYKDNTMSDYENIGADTRIACTGYNADTLNIEIYTTDFTKETTFRCVVTDGSQTTHSEAATVIDEELPRIKTQPQEIAVKMGETGSTMFEAESGRGVLSYEWQYKKDDMTDFVPMDGSLSGVYYTGPGLYVQMQDYLLEGNYQFRCKVTDEANYCVYTDAVGVKLIVDPLEIDTQSYDAVAGIDEAVQFSVSVKGGKPDYAYEWEWTKDGMDGYKPCSEAEFYVGGYLTGLFTPTTTSEFFTENYRFRCKITDALGTIIYSEPVTVIRNLHFTAHPTTQVVLPEEYATFSVAVDGGGGTKNYQWYMKNDGSSTPVALNASHDAWASGYNTAELRVKLSQTEIVQNYRFYCMVTDDTDTIESGVAYLKEVYRISTQPRSYAAYIGSNVILMVLARGGQAPVEYHWEYSNDGGAVYDKITAAEDWAVNYDTQQLKITVKESMIVKGWKFRCVITDATGTTLTSEAVQISELAPPIITTQPVNQNVKIGDEATFTVAVTGGAGYYYSYQWYEHTTATNAWIAITGATDSSLVVEMTADERNYQSKYKCVITDALGAQLESNEAKPIFPLEIIKQPTNATVALNKTATFTVEVTPGRGPYKYTWYYSDGGNYFKVDNSVPMAGYASATLTVPQTYEYFYTYTFYCLVIDAYGQRVESDVVRILKP